MSNHLAFNIRMANLCDAEAIASIHIRTWQKMYREFIPENILKNLSLAERTQQWTNLLKQKVDVLLIEIDHQAVGFTSICLFRGVKTKSSIGEISAIYISPQYWRRGLGSKLCEAAFSELAKQGYNKVSLWVLEANEQARAFYEALGFNATSQTKLEEFYHGGALLQEILYEKIL